MSDKKTVLVLYYSRGVYPLRDTIETSLYSWKRYSNHNVLYINLAFGFPERLISQLSIDAVIYHTICLSMRWAPEMFHKYTQMTYYLNTLDCIKIALPQDEFIHTEMLAEFLDRAGITHLGTCAKESEWPKVYKKLQDKGVKLFTVLTGYLDRNTVDRVLKLPDVKRDIDIGYRAWRAQYWLGEHGMHKVWVCEKFEEACANTNLKTDLSMNDEDVLHGDDWFTFLKRCKTTIGVEGGASILDKHGDYKKAVEQYLSKHPDASFEEVRDACFATQDNTFDLACISPRHMEACLTKTCQVLIEGNYSGVLEPDVHYIAIKKDYSNLKEVLELINDDEYVNDMTQRAFDHVVSGKWYYDRFVQDTLSAYVDSVPTKRKSGLQQAYVSMIMKARDHLTWLYIRLEVYALKNNSRIARGILKYLSRVVAPL
jgi:hypothetical protein